MNRILRSLAAASLVIAGSLNARAASVAVTESDPLNPDGRVHVENVNGSIEVRAWDGEGVKLEAVKKGRSVEVAEAITIRVDSTPERLKITTELAPKKGWFASGQREGSVDYTLHVPAGCHLDKASSVNGSITVVGVTGSVRAASVNGGIAGRRLGGTLDLSTVNGRIECESIAPQSAERMSLTTVNGAIELSLPKDTDARLESRSVNGSIRTELAVADVEHGRHRLSGRLGEGGPELRMKTVNGAIRLRAVNAGEL